MKTLINIASFYWVCVIYILHNQYFLFSYGIDSYMNILFYLFVGFIMGWFSLKILKKNLSDKKRECLKIGKIFPIYREFMPIYLAIVVVAFGIKGVTQIQDSYAVFVIFFFIYVLFHISNIGYLNPVWYMLGYRIYKIESFEATYVLITKKDDYKNIDRIENLKKIDEFTFYESEE